MTPSYKNSEDENSVISVTVHINIQYLIYIYIYILVIYILFMNSTEPIKRISSTYKKVGVLPIRIVRSNVSSVSVPTFLYF